MTRAALKSWLAAYGRAWETRDPEAVTDLFREDATYQVTPFAEPMRGRATIREYWARAVEQSQRQPRFGFEILAVSANAGIARWWASFTRISPQSRVRLDGIFVLTFDARHFCRSLREWWVKHEIRPLPSRAKKAIRRATPNSRATVKE